MSGPGVSRANLSRIVAVVPVRSLSGAKSRLGEPLDGEERADLVLALLRRTVAAALSSRRLYGVAVVSQDADLLAQARAMGAASLLQQSDGLNEGLTEARDSACGEATALLVLPADLPGVSAQAIDRLAETAAETAARADRIPFRFGEGSRAAHAAEAAAAGAAYVELDGPLSFDVDTPEDLLEADRIGLDHEAGR